MTNKQKKWPGFAHFLKIMTFFKDGHLKTLRELLVNLIKKIRKVSKHLGTTCHQTKLKNLGTCMQNPRQ